MVGAAVYTRFRDFFEGHYYLAEGERGLEALGRMLTAKHEGRRTPFDKRRPGEIRRWFVPARARRDDRCPFAGILVRLNVLNATVGGIEAP